MRAEALSTGCDSELRKLLHTQAELEWYGLATVLLGWVAAFSC